LRAIRGVAISLGDDAATGGAIAWPRHLGHPLPARADDSRHAAHGRRTPAVLQFRPIVTEQQVQAMA
jgi:hypothetical protein